LRTPKEDAMPDSIRRVDYYYVVAPDKPGEGGRIFGALRDAGVNLLAVHAFPTARKSQIDFVPADAVAFLAAAKNAKLKLSKPKTVFLVEGDDRVGAMARGVNRRTALTVAAAQHIRAARHLTCLVRFI